MTARVGMETRQNWLALARKYWQIMLWTGLGFMWLKSFLLFCVFFILRLGHLAGKPIAGDPPCRAPECDFSMFWPSGLLARAGDFAVIYQPDRFLAFQRHVLIPSSSPDPYIYPPFTLLLSAAISWLPFELAFFAWTLLFAVVFMLCLHCAGLPRMVVLVSLLCPAILWNFEMGQVSDIAAGLLVFGLMRVDSNQFRSGLALGFLSFKPQTGILVPFALLGGKYFRGLSGFFGIVVVIALATLLCFGPTAWYAYFQYGKPQSMQLLDAPFSPYSYMGGGISFFWLFRSLGIELPFAGLFQTCSAALAILACLWVWRRDDLTPLTKVAGTVLLSILSTPYGYINDMVAGSVMLAALAARRGWRLHISDVLFWIWPSICQTITIRTGILFSPLVVIFALWHTAHDAGLFSCRSIKPAA